MVVIGQKQKSGMGGFTLIELMVALVLGLLVMGMLATVYMGNMRSAQFQNGVLRVQENGRFAVDMMSRTIRMAGYDDPVNGTTVGVTIDGVTDASNADLLINTKTGTGIMTDTDIIAVTFEGGPGIRDCEGRGPNSTKYPFHLLEARTSQYAVRNDFSLICLTSAMLVDEEEGELAEGVEDMQILYGVDPDEDGVANHYAPADEVGDWSKITSVEVTLLINSIYNVLPTPDDVCLGCVVFPGTTDPPDKLMRAEFQTIVDIRN